MAYHVEKDLRHWAPISVNCTCLRVRKAALALTDHFESYLAPLNINSTQYSILTVLDIIDGSSVCQLAEIIAMPRKTLARHLKPLELRKLISIEQGSDKRERTAIAAGPPRSGRTIRLGTPFIHRYRPGNIPRSTHRLRPRMQADAEDR